MHSVKWKYGYLIFKKKKDFRCCREIFKSISSDAKVPMKAFPASARYDLYAAERKTIVSHGRELIKTNLCLEIPKRYYGRVVGRSGLANFKGIFAFSGTADSEYKGNVCVVLFNLSNFTYIVEIGNRFGQFLVEKRNDIKFVEYNSLSKSDWSYNGFGSTLGFKQLPCFCKFCVVISSLSLNFKFLVRIPFFQEVKKKN